MVYVCDAAVVGILDADVNIEERANSDGYAMIHPCVGGWEWCSATQDDISSECVVLVGVVGVIFSVEVDEVVAGVGRGVRGVMCDAVVLVESS